MSHHDAVSCDACMKSSFSGNRYKCLICYDYDLCSTCFEAGATSAQHIAHHPMQCILARADYDLYYAGEDASRSRVPLSFTCPFCCRMGFSDVSLHTHINNEHADDSFEVICPVCTATPGADPNHVTDDLIAHLMLEHRGAVPYFDDPQTAAAAAAASAAASAAAASAAESHHALHSGTRGMGRMHRDVYQYHSPSSTLSALSSGGGGGGHSGQDTETIDSMSELLYQLTTIKSRGSTIQSLSSQLQQLELQLQSTRHQLDGLPGHQSRQRVAEATTTRMMTTTNSQIQTTSESKNKSNRDKNFLLASLEEASLSDFDEENAEVERADKALFLQELILIMLNEDEDQQTLKNNHQLRPNSDDSAVSNCNTTLVPSSSSSPSSAGSKITHGSCDDDVKPVAVTTGTQREALAKETSSSVATHQSHENRPEMHPPHPQQQQPPHKSRLHPPQKVLRHRTSKESVPPRK